ncbi:hypothetical protein Ancab_027378 [Ancistrocladus abbreviatus]
MTSPRSHLLLHHIFKPPPAFLCPLPLLLTPCYIVCATASRYPHHKPLLRSSSTPPLPLLSTRPPFASFYTSIHDVVSAPNDLAEVLSPTQHNIIDVEEGEDEIEESRESERRGGNAIERTALTSSSSGICVPNLTVKEKKELASYAHSLGDKLKSQQVGKLGVTDNVVMALIETLEANELLKLKIHRSCPGELDDVVRQLEQATGSVNVGQIGRTVILYRPSLAKMKAEEKKKQACKVFIRRKRTSKPPLMIQRTGEVSRKSNSGRRGSSRF